MLKRLVFVMLLLIFSSPVWAADEIITSYKDESLPVLNEELRKMKTDITNEVSTHTLMWYVSGALTASTISVGPRITVPFTGTITKAHAYVGTAPTDASLLLDIHKNGTTLWSSGQLTVTSGSNTGSTTTFDSTTATTNDYFDFYVDQVGSTVAGSDLTVELVIQE